MKQTKIEIGPNILQKFPYKEEKITIIRKGLKIEIEKDGTVKIYQNGSH